MKVPAHVAQFHADLHSAFQQREAETPSRPVTATGLPADSAVALLQKWDQAAASYRTGGEISQAVANAFEICADGLRAELEAVGADIKSERTVEASFGTAMPFKASDLSPAKPQP